jgi:uncharacterized DUF497 family protein
MRFEWDAAKAAANLRKHGVSFDEASTVFADNLSATGRDPDHSIGESRLITFGLSRNGRVLAVSHTDRSGVVRIISARAATPKERRIYEEEA